MFSAYLVPLVPEISVLSWFESQFDRGAYQKLSKVKKEVYVITFLNIS